MMSAQLQRKGSASQHELSGERPSFRGGAAQSRPSAYAGTPIAGGIDPYVNVRIGSGSEVTGITLYTPRLERMAGKATRLRGASEVLSDPGAWEIGEFTQLQRDISGPVEVSVNDVSLAYEEPGPGDTSIAVPVYRFDVRICEIETGRFEKAIWTLVAAGDVKAPSFIDFGENAGPTQRG